MNDIDKILRETFKKWAEDILRDLARPEIAELYKKTEGYDINVLKEVLKNAVKMPDIFIYNKKLRTEMNIIEEIKEKLKKGGEE